MEEDRKILRELAREYADVVSDSVFDQRARDWTRLHDLKSDKPMFLFESSLIDQFVGDDELKTSGENRYVEKRLRQYLRHNRYLNDSVVFPKYFELQHAVQKSDYGVALSYTHNQTTQSIVSNHPVKDVADVCRLKERTFVCDKSVAEREKLRIEEIFGDILPVKVVGQNILLPAITRILYDLIDSENFFIWLYDEPEAIGDIVAYLKRDVLSYFDFLEREDLLTVNGGCELVGSGSYGFCSEIGRKKGDKVSVSDMWVWAESQETATVSPDMFAEIFLPAMAEIANKFALTYYGCCEQLHDRFDEISSAIGNIRSVSVSPWSDIEIMAEKLKNRYVFSKKLTPQFYTNNDLKSLVGEVERVLKATGGKNVELIYRDVYQVRDHLETLSEMSRTVRDILG